MRGMGWAKRGECTAECYHVLDYLQFALLFRFIYDDTAHNAAKVS